MAEEAAGQKNHLSFLISHFSFAIAEQMNAANGVEYTYEKSVLSFNDK